MIHLNLLPDVKREFLRTERMRVKVIGAAFVFSLVAIGITVVVALWVYGAQALQQKLLTDSIKENDQKLRSIKDIDKYVTIQRQLSAITALHDGKNLYSRLFDYLPALNSGVKLSGVTLTDVDHTLAIEGSTADYRTLTVFRDTLLGASVTYKDASGKEQKTPLFQSVVIESNGLGAAESGQALVSFKIIAAYPVEVFRSSVSSPVISVPKKDTTPSTVGTPTVFESTEGAQ